MGERGWVRGWKDDEGARPNRPLEGQGWSNGVGRVGDAGRQEDGGMMGKNLVVWGR